MSSGESPIYVAGMSFETLGFAVERRLPVLLSLERPEGLQLQRWREIGKTPEQAADLRRYSLNRYVFIGKTDVEAQARPDREALLDPRRARQAAMDAQAEEIEAPAPDRAACSKAGTSAAGHGAERAAATRGPTAAAATTASASGEAANSSDGEEADLQRREHVGRQSD